MLEHMPDDDPAQAKTIETSDAQTAVATPASAVDSFAQTLLSGASGDARPVDAMNNDASFAGERYTVRRVIGAGGMGEVRLCSDAWIGRDVAMKVAHPGAGGSVAQTRGRFLREARVQGQLEHPSVVPVYDLGHVGSETFFTMKRIGGHTLEQIVSGLKEGRADICAKYNRRKLLSAMSQVCLTVAYAHTRGVIHRDLKPANIMLGDFGEVYVLDWGVAKLETTPDDVLDSAKVVDTGARAVTQAGAIIGTPGYMAPEQAVGETITPKVDVYALGAILFELLALEPLHAGRTAMELLASTMKATLAPSQRAPTANIAPELDALVLSAVAGEPNERLGSARAMQEAIEAFLDGERDAERRRELASEHVKNARNALARAAQRGRDSDADHRGLQSRADVRLVRDRHVRAARLAGGASKPSARRLRRRGATKLCASLALAAALAEVSDGNRVGRSLLAGGLGCGRGCCRCRRRSATHLGLLVARVAVKRACRRELTELVPDHALRHEDGDELAAVVHRERETDGLRRDGAAA